MNSGSVTFSFDCEGKWGMMDHPRKWNSQLTQNELLKAYEFILNTLHVNNISATFAFVGAFTETREDFLNESLGKLDSRNHILWLEHSKHKMINKTEEGWFMPELLEMVKEYNTHEIATHSYTHIPFDMLDTADALIELNLVKRWAEKKNIDCKTIVYPRNIIKHQSLLEEFGIFGYRGRPEDILPKRFHKIIKTLAEEIWILKKAQQIEMLNEFKIPGGVFINWGYGFRNFIPSSVSLLKYKSMINDAKLRRRVAHFWIHPHNFITSPSTKKLFIKLCEEVSIQRDQHTLVIKKQNDYLCKSDSRKND